MVRPAVPLFTVVMGGGHIPGPPPRPAGRPPAGTPHPSSPRRSGRAFRTGGDAARAQPPLHRAA